MFWNDNGVAMVCGRTLDWETSDEPRLWAIPRGTRRDSGPEAGPHAIEWTAEYGTVAMQGWACTTTEAVNDAGLSARVLYLGSTDYEPADDRPVVANLVWAQYAADNFATVSDAVAGLAEVRVASLPMRGQHLGAHLLLEDSSGDSALIELLNGKATVHHGRRYDVVANDPPYDEQVANLKLYRPWGGALGIPGDIVSEERFVRATYYRSHLPAPADAAEAIAGVFGVVRNCQVPYGAPDSRFDTYPTWWASATDLTNRTYYFQSTRAPNVVWLELDALDLSPGSGVRALDPRDVTLSGSIAGALEPAELDWAVA
ncbi:linear amide C-N hydrolase [Conexibacter sp. CPCC 206217]|uniref:linear amide C-N hydrolase n=1 Tax=Conexibacter sp. CPCC 206217 TaxID=3064574 RepID=UPI0027157B57|nr:linear amide C-N hydrolase [Conexibacter sp. CPCC 206217]MDO8212308.1 linear amide C-N hydrolase [Conexibacter sp. CPCC 206217]